MAVRDLKKQVEKTALSSFSASLSLNCPMPQSQFRRQLHGLQMSGFCLTWKPARQLVFQKGLKFQPVVVLQNGKIATNKKGEGVTSDPSAISCHSCGKTEKSNCQPNWHWH